MVEPAGAHAAIIKNKRSCIIVFITRNTMDPNSRLCLEVTSVRSLQCGTQVEGFALLAQATGKAALA